MKAEITYRKTITKDFKEEIATATITLEPYDNGWQWTSDGGLTWGRTNENGNGLWDGNNQQLGTNQFSLPAKGEKALRKLSRLHAKSKSTAGSGQIKDIRITS